MTNSARAAAQLLLYRKYSDMAHRSNGELSETYGCMARYALRQAAELDPATVDRANALAMVIVG
jgi:hypothetical protein